MAGINPLTPGSIPPVATAATAAGGFPWGTIASIGIPLLIDLLTPKSRQEKEFEANIARLLATTRGGYDYYSRLIGGMDPKITEALFSRLSRFKDWGFPAGG